MSLSTTFVLYPVNSSLVHLSLRPRRLLLLRTLTLLLLLHRPPRPTIPTGAANARRSVGPWRGSPLASPSAMTLVPRCRWQRRPHRDMMHVASVHFKCFRCFRSMLQVFHTDVAKVDRDVTYVAMVVHVCCKHLSLMFHLCFQTYVASVFILMLCFRHML